MKKILGTVLILGLAAVGVSGCTKESLPEKKESETIAQIPAGKAPVEVVAKTGSGAVLVEHPVAGSVTSAIQSSAQTSIRARGSIVGGVTAAALSSSQAAARKEGGAASQDPT